MEGTRHSDTNGAGRYHAKTQSCDTGFGDSIPDPENHMSNLAWYSDTIDRNRNVETRKPRPGEHDREEV